MYPTFHLGLDFPAYFTLLMLGYVLVVRLGVRVGVRQGLNGNQILDLALVLLVAGIVGARALHVAADGFFMDYVHLCSDPFLVKGEPLPKGEKCTADAQCEQRGRKGYETCNPATGICHQPRDCLRAFKFWYGGLTYYGGLGLAILAGILYVRWKRMPLWEIGDLAGFAIPGGLVFGRLGCFLAGCCFGGTCDADHGVVFPAGSPAWEQHVDLGLIGRSAGESLPVWPTQLWEAGACLAIALFARWMVPRRRFAGQVFFTSMMLYAVVRFVIEFWRADPRGDYWGLATSQWLSFPLLAFGAVMYWREGRVARRAR
jgi:phosphatidylglycerol:prolipoprotein diacylglycerol transferase